MLLHTEHLIQESELSYVRIKIQDISEEIWRKDERLSQYIIYKEINWLNASESRNVAYANQPMQPFISRCRFISHARWHPITQLINTSFSCIALLKPSAMHVTCRRTLRNQLQNICREKVVFAKIKQKKKKKPLNKLSRLKAKLMRDISHKRHFFQPKWVDFSGANSFLPLRTNHTPDYFKFQVCISCFNPLCHQFGVFVLIIHRASNVTSPCANHHRSLFSPLDQRHRLSIGIRRGTPEWDISEICSGTSFIKCLLNSQWEIWLPSRMGVNAAWKFNQFPDLI